jgi:hypothetical protein
VGYDLGVYVAKKVEHAADEEETQWRELAAALSDQTQGVQDGGRNVIAWNEMRYMTHSAMYVGLIDACHLQLASPYTAPVSGASREHCLVQQDPAS